MQTKPHYLDSVRDVLAQKGVDLDKQVASAPSPKKKRGGIVSVVTPNFLNEVVGQIFREGVYSDNSVMPTAVLCSSIFHPFAKTEIVDGVSTTTKEDNVQVYRRDDIDCEIRFTGRSLTMSDQDVFLVCLRLWFDARLEFGSPVSFCATDFLDRLDYKKSAGGFSGQHYTILLESFKRLAGCKIDIRVGKVTAKVGLIETLVWNTENRQYAMKISHEVANLFAVDGHTFVNQEERLSKIGKGDYTKWLYGYLRCRPSGELMLENLALKARYPEDKSKSNFIANTEAAVKKFVEIGVLVSAEVVKNGRGNQKLVFTKPAPKSEAPDPYLPPSGSTDVKKMTTRELKRERLERQTEHERQHGLPKPKLTGEALIANNERIKNEFLRDEEAKDRGLDHAERDALNGECVRVN